MSSTIFSWLCWRAVRLTTDATRTNPSSVSIELTPISTGNRKPSRRRP
ncbi:MAG: hypothetical protein R2909_22895 [Gemmatimonadales bacterium]